MVQLQNLKELSDECHARGIIIQPPRGILQLPFGLICPSGLTFASQTDTVSMGEDFGQDTRQTPNQPNPVKWSLLENPSNRDLWEHYQKLLHYVTKTLPYTQKMW
jgi:hypothetical protein